jgi:hypothetical protein
MAQHFQPPNSDNFVGFLTQIKISPGNLCYSTRVRQIVAETGGGSPSTHGAPDRRVPWIRINDAGFFLTSKGGNLP